MRLANSCMLSSATVAGAAGLRPGWTTEVAVSSWSGSAEAVEIAPEFRPALQQVMAQVDVGVVAAFFVDHVVGIRVVRYKLAAFEMLFHEVVVEADSN